MTKACSKHKEHDGNCYVCKIDQLVEALERGDYNAKPSELKQGSGHYYCHECGEFGSHKDDCSGKTNE